MGPGHRRPSLFRCWSLVSFCLLTITLTISAGPLQHRQRYVDSIMVDPLEPLETTTKGTHNLIPRHNLPKGNLSNQDNPYWEAIYYLKYGLLPPKLEYNGTDLASRLHLYQNFIDDSTHNRRAEGDNEVGLEENVDSEPANVVDEVKGAIGTLFRVSRDGVLLPDMNEGGIQGSLRLYPSYKEALEETGRMQLPNYHWTENDFKSVLNIVPPKIKTAYRPSFAALRKDQDFPTFRNFQKSPKSFSGLTRRAPEEASDFGILNKRGNMVYIAKVKTRRPVEQSLERIRIGSKDGEAEPIQLLRNFLMDREDQDQITTGKSRKAISSVTRNMFLKNLVARSAPNGSGAGPPGNPSQGGGGLEGSGRKFQTQGWKK